MDFSAANTELWNIIIQLGIIAAMVLIANLLRRELPFVRNSLMPTAVLAGFLLLILRSTGIINIDMDLLEMITYHGIAVGFIALSLRVPKPNTADEAGSMTAPKSGALIVSTYLVQGITGLVITIALAYTVMPDIFKAAGILLPMGYGQGPGQANNIGSTFEALGFAGGRSFGLSLAAAGYLCACIVGVVYINVLNRRGKLQKHELDRDVVSGGSVTVDTFQDEGELPISQSIDKLSIQAMLVAVIYFITYLVTRGLTAGLSALAPGAADTLNSLLWGFNFIIGSALAMAARSIFKALKKGRLMKLQYQNNYLLSRLSGLAFDVMIVAGIASIDIDKLTGLWLPFALMAVAGGVVTLLYLRWICKKLYPNYYYEGLTSMYGMLTGTISSGVLLLREIDPDLSSPAANNLVTGSSFGILFGVPMLILVGLAPKSNTLLFIVLGLMIVYLALLLLFMLKAKRRVKNK